MLQGDGRARLSSLWVPTGGIAATSAEGILGLGLSNYPAKCSVDSHAKLIRAGFLRQVMKTI